MYLGMHTMDELLLGLMFGSYFHFMFNAYFEEFLFKMYHFFFKNKIRETFKYLLILIFLNIILLAIGIIQYVYMK